MKRGGVAGAGRGLCHEPSRDGRGEVQKGLGAACAPQRWMESTAAGPLGSPARPSPVQPSWPHPPTLPLRQLLRQMLRQVLRQMMRQMLRQTLRQVLMLAHL